MDIKTFDTAALAAEYAADTVEALLREKPDAVLCLAAGHTSCLLYTSTSGCGPCSASAAQRWVGRTAIPKR